jgi:hypothetical protein
LPRRLRTEADKPLHRRWTLDTRLAIAGVAVVGRARYGADAGCEVVVRDYSRVTVGRALIDTAANVLAAGARRAQWGDARRDAPITCAHPEAAAHYPPAKE